MIRVAFLAAVLTGCAQPPYWVKVEPEFVSKEIRVHLLDSYFGEISPGTQGFAKRREDGTCDIFIFRKVFDKACVEAHERRHCGDGSPAHDHPDYPYNFMCRQ